MTPEQRQLAYDLVVAPPSGRPQISKESFATRFPEALDDGTLSVSLLAQACGDRNAEDLQCALIIGFAFHFSPQHEQLLCRLALADWHMSHEDIISALDELGAVSEEAVAALYGATQISLPYLAYDRSRALAVRAIWTLGRIPGTIAETKLKMLATSEEPILRVNAEQQLKRRKG